MKDERSLIEAVLGDGRFLIALTGISLTLSGAFAILQSVSGQILPQDAHALGMDATALVHAGNDHLLSFMFHDRVAYGGTLLAVGFGYLWLVEFPLRSKAPWAWWALASSGFIGFLAFLTYLGQGYLDTWHGVATLFLLPVFLAGLWRCRPSQFSLKTSDSQVLSPNLPVRLGRILLSLCALGVMLAGATIAIFGMTTVFVPSDLRFIAIPATQLAKISPSLIPVISHDRAGFGGGLCSVGCLLLFISRYAELNRSLVEIVALMGAAGFAAAIGVHFVVGYVDFFHLLPAFSGLILFVLAVSFLWIGWRTASLQDEKQNSPDVVQAQ